MLRNDQSSFNNLRLLSLPFLLCTHVLCEEEYVEEGRCFVCGWKDKCCWFGVTLEWVVAASSWAAMGQRRLYEAML